MNKIAQYYADYGHLPARQNAQASQAQLSDYFDQMQQQAIVNNWRGQRDMTASDLGIVDQLLDDKVGMEP